MSREGNKLAKEANKLAKKSNWFTFIGIILTVVGMVYTFCSEVIPYINSSKEDVEIYINELSFDIDGLYSEINENVAKHFVQTEIVNKDYEYEHLYPSKSSFITLSYVLTITNTSDNTISVNNIGLSQINPISEKLMANVALIENIFVEGKNYFKKKENYLKQPILLSPNESKILEFNLNFPIDKEVDDLINKEFKHNTVLNGKNIQEYLQLNYLVDLFGNKYKEEYYEDDITAILLSDEQDIDYTPEFMINLYTSKGNNIEIIIKNDNNSINRYLDNE